MNLVNIRKGIGVRLFVYYGFPDKIGLKVPSVDFLQMDFPGVGDASKGVLEGALGL